MIATYISSVIVYYFLFLAAFAPVMGIVAYLNDRFESVPFAALLAKGLLIAVALVYLFVIPWVAHLAAKAKTYHDASFIGAISSAMAQVRVLLSFVPVVGFLFSGHEENEMQ